MVNFFSVPSLKTIALNKISITLCYKTGLVSDLDQKIVKKDRFHLRDWVSRLHSVECSLNRLQLPKELIDEIKESHHVIATQICYFVDRNYGTIMYQILKDHPDLVGWNPYGIIDGEKTISNIIEYNERNIECMQEQIPTWKVFGLACFYSYRNIIEDLRPEIDNAVLPLNIRRELTKCPLMEYWLNHERLSTLSYYKLFLYALVRSNITSMQYLRNKLSEEQNNSIFSLFKNIASSDFVNTLYHPIALDILSILYVSTPTIYLLSIFTDVQLKVLFRRYSLQIMKHFLISLDKRFFLTIFNMIDTYLSPKTIYRLLVSLAEVPDSAYFSYRKVFMMLFDKCHVNVKHQIIKKALKGTHILLRILTQKNEVRCIHLLLCFASYIQRLKMKVIIKRMRRKEKDKSRKLWPILNYRKRNDRERIRRLM